LSVRKAAMKCLKDLCIQQSQSIPIDLVCSKILQHLNDEEDSARVKFSFF